jgi:hypothetical protein
LRTQFELYEFGDPDPPEAFDAERAITGIWISRQHLGDHTLSESTGKIMERWVQECLDSHEERRHTLMGGYSPTRRIDVGPKGGLKEPSLVEVGELPFDRLLGIPQILIKKPILKLLKQKRFLHPYVTQLRVILEAGPNTCKSPWIL